MEGHGSREDEYLYMMGQDTDTSKTPKVLVKISDVEVEMIVDTVASMDILDETTILQNQPPWQH